MTMRGWSHKALDAYKSAGKDMQDAGYQAMRDIADKDCGTMLTIWGSSRGTVIMQTFIDSGDVVFFKAVAAAEVL